MFYRLTAFIVLVFFLSPVFAQQIQTGEWKNFTKSVKFPDGVKPMRSNNNVDLIKYKDRYYVAFRTAPSHFASRKVCMYVLSSTDFENWKLENTVQLGSDVREPRFYQHHDSLFLCFFQAGKSIFSFSPEKLWITSTTGDNQWSALADAGMDGFVPWRVREHDGLLYLSAYYGKNLYNNKHTGNLRLFTSTNGFNWEPLSENAQVELQGAEEGEFIFDELGKLWGLVRLEGSGSLLAEASANNTASWKLTPSKYKYDSALLFGHKSNIFLVSRRNLDGEAERAPAWMLTSKMKRIYNMLRYSFTQKCTSVFSLDKQEKKFDLLLDFPSTGDNAFPAIVQKNENEYFLMNYSSDIEGINKHWFRGQMGKTYLYYTVLKVSGE